MSQPKGENAMRSTPWTLDKTINLPFLLVCASACVSAVIWASGVDNKLEKMQEQVAQVKNETLAIPRISAKLERLDERSLIMQRNVENMSVIRVAK